MNHKYLKSIDKRNKDQERIDFFLDSIVEFVCTWAGILEAPVQGSDHDMAVQVKKLYQSCSNVSQINAIGEKPLR